MAAVMVVGCGSLGSLIPQEIVDNCGRCSHICGCVAVVDTPKAMTLKDNVVGPRSHYIAAVITHRLFFNHAQTVFQNLGCIYLYNMIYKPGCSSTLNNRVMPELYTHSRLWFLSLFLSCGLIAVTMGFELLFCS